jgi:hypothetical protein
MDAKIETKKSTEVVKGYAQKKVVKVTTFFLDKTNKLYCYFLQAVIPLFKQANLILQKEEPSIHKLQRTLIKQPSEILVRFVKPDHLGSDLTKVDYTSKLVHKTDDTLFIGKAARDFIKTNPELNLQKFFTATSYMLKKFPFNDELVVHAEVADPELRIAKDFSSVVFFTDRFSCLLPSNVPEFMDQLEGQFLNYQVDDCPEFERVDHFWSHMKSVKDENGQKKYNLLADVMLAVLTIFHSNADSERIFSVVTKNKNKFRPNLSTPVLSSIITHKMCLQSRGQVCHTAQISKDTLKRTKQATAAKLAQY